MFLWKMGLSLIPNVGCIPGLTFMISECETSTWGNDCLFVDKPGFQALEEFAVWNEQGHSPWSGTQG